MGRSTRSAQVSKGQGQPKVSGAWKSKFSLWALPSHSFACMTHSLLCLVFLEDTTRPSQIPSLPQHACLLGMFTKGKSLLCLSRDPEITLLLANKKKIQQSASQKDLIRPHLDPTDLWSKDSVTARTVYPEKEGAVENMHNVSRILRAFPSFHKNISQNFKKQHLDTMHKTQ